MSVMEICTSVLPGPAEILFNRLLVYSLPRILGSVKTALLMMLSTVPSMYTQAGGRISWPRPAANIAHSKEEVAELRFIWFKDALYGSRITVYTGPIQLLAADKMKDHIHTSVKCYSLRNLDQSKGSFGSILG